MTGAAFRSPPTRVLRRNEHRGRGCHVVGVCESYSTAAVIYMMKMLCSHSYFQCCFPAVSSLYDTKIGRSFGTCTGDTVSYASHPEQCILITGRFGDPIRRNHFARYNTTAATIIVGKACTASKTID